MANKNDGGPAFPATRTEHVQALADPQHREPLEIVYPGMSLRDYFAAKAMAGWLATWPDDAPLNNPEGVAKTAYRVADAMLKEREK